MQKSRIARAVVLTVLMILGLAGCSKPQGQVKEVKVDAISKPAEDPWKASKASDQEKERFRKQVADQAEFFRQTEQIRLRHRQEVGRQVDLG
jgi:ABC-type metal ion transport system substrate-binding protein